MSIVPEQIIRNKQYRGQIMKVVAMFYPSPVTIDQLKIALSSYGASFVADLAKHLHFLADDAGDKSPAYIRLPGPVEHLGDDDKIYITRAGIKLVEGSLSDEDIRL
ncbi:hypothetical protein KQR54_18820 [Mycobacterium gordonae]|nr:hypothetical protein [Mycobacterium gordonae]